MLASTTGKLELSTGKVVVVLFHASFCSNGTLFRLGSPVVHARFMQCGSAVWGGAKFRLRFLEG